VVQGEGPVSGTSGQGGAFLSYKTAVFPVTVSLGGTTKDSSGNYSILIGQGCTASLSGIPSGCTVSNYQWSVSGNTFQTWSADTPAVGNNPYNPDASYYVDGPGPLTNPTAQWFWNDILGTQQETVSCTATVTPPAGQGNAFTVTATKQVTVMRPGFTITGTGGNMQVNTATPASNGSDYWLYAGPAAGSSKTAGMVWDATVSSPNPTLFGMGSLIMVQIINPNLSYTGTDWTLVPSHHPWSENGKQGLDLNYPYNWTRGAPNYYGGDLPGINVTYYQSVCSNIGHAMVSAQVSDQFEDYLMYFAPGSNQCVPLAYLPWSTDGNATLPSTGNWASFGSGSAGAIIPSGMPRPFYPSKDFPMWTLIRTHLINGLL